MRERDGGRQLRLAGTKGTMVMQVWGLAGPGGIQDELPL